jgi:hypothetical protein
MDILAHRWLAVRAPLVTGLTHVGAFGLRTQKRFF